MITQIINALRENNLIVTFKGNRCFIRSIMDDDEGNDVYIPLESYAEALKTKKKTLRQILDEAKRNLKYGGIS